MSERKVPLETAGKLALEVIGLLAETYTRVAVGGSIRRGCAEVGDIEIVMRPVSDVAIWRRCQNLLARGIVEKRLNSRGAAIAWGSEGKPCRFKAMVYKGVAVDLFLVLEDRQWGPTMVLRTGPAEANAALVTQLATRNYQFDVAGVCPPGVVWKDGQLWRYGEMLDTPEERHVFAALGLPWVHPDLRSAARYRMLAVRNSIPAWWWGHMPIDGEPDGVNYVYAPDGEYVLTGLRPAAAREMVAQGALFEAAGAHPPDYYKT
jgi:DNA polymerase/3'-5' exonuclease PolX